MTTDSDCPKCNYCGCRAAGEVEVINDRTGRLAWLCCDHADQLLGASTTIHWWREVDRGNA